MDNFATTVAATENAVQAIASEVHAIASTPFNGPGALGQLMAGNKRYISDARLADRRKQLVDAQQPFAIILSCSDSRVPVDTVFDQIPGNIFSIRVAGNFVARDVLGSVEYAVAHLHAPLILVLGHSKCGAVTAAFQYVNSSEPVESGAIQYLVQRITPAIRGVATVNDAITTNTRAAMRDLRAQSSIVAGAVTANTLTISGGIYDLGTGAVTIFS